MTVLENALEALGLLEKYLAMSNYPYDVDDWLTYISIALETMSDMRAALKELAGLFNASKGYDPAKFTVREWIALQNAHKVLEEMKGEK